MAALHMLGWQRARGFVHWRKAAKEGWTLFEKHNDCVAFFDIQPQPNHIVFVDFLCLGSG
jgi:hypothetical protein